MPRFEKQGVKLAAISYDSGEILKFFADRHKIEYPMLGDPDSKIIKAYGVLNPEATGMQKGFARPGYFFIDAKGVIREKFFEAKYRERITGNNIISKLFPELGQEVIETVEAPNLQVALEQSDRVGVPGTRLTVAVRVTLPTDVHVYAPGAQGYKPIKLVLDPVPQLELKPPVFPESKILYMPAIKERVPVFGESSKFQGSLNIRLVTKPSASCRNPSRSSGNCKSFLWIGCGLRRIFGTNRRAGG